MRDCDDKDIDKAYNFCRVMARKFEQTHPRPVYYMDEEDYTQEAMLAWLTKKHIPYKLIDAFRKASPISRTTWLKIKDNLALYDPIDLDSVSDKIESPSEEMESIVHNKALSQKVLNLVSKLNDPRKQIIVVMHYFYDLSFTEIGKGLNLSKAYISRLHKESIEDIKKEILGE